MENFICTTCGVEYELTNEAPSTCIICNEERQYINPQGQSWTTLEKMQQSSTYKNIIQQEEEGIYSITTTPKVGIGQTAYLIQGEDCNILWDCITYLDEETINQIKELGGIDVIALSHPHYYSTQVHWAEIFNATVYIHEDDQEWVTRNSTRINFWSNESLLLTNEFEIIRLGGHFKGGAVLNWKNGYKGNGILFSGDIIQVVADTNWVSFMYSYPNLIPLPAKTVERMANQMKTYHFKRLYNAFHKKIEDNADQVVQRSAQRYIDALAGKLFQT